MTSYKVVRKPKTELPHGKNEKRMMLLYSWLATKPMSRLQITKTIRIFQKKVGGGVNFTLEWLSSLQELVNLGWVKEVK